MRTAKLFWEWQEVSHELVRERVTLRRFCSHWRAAHVGRLFRCWQQAVAERKKINILLKRGIAKFARRSELRYFREWSLCSRERGSARRMWTRVESVRRLSWVPHVLRRALSTWEKEIVTKKFQEKKLLSKQTFNKELTMKREKMLRRLSSRKCRRECEQCLLWWRRWCEKELELNQRRHFVLLRWTRLSLSSTFAAWRHNVQESKVTREKMSRCLQSVQRRELHRSMSMLRFNMEESRRRSERIIVFCTMLSRSWRRRKLWMMMRASG